MSSSTGDNQSDDAGKSEKRRAVYKVGSICNEKKEKREKKIKKMIFCLKKRNIFLEKR